MKYKKPINISLLFLLLIVGLLFYLWSDNRSYEYGLKCNFCNISLPYNVKPHDGSDFSFTLNGDDGLELVGIGFRFFDSKITIKDFLAYGYNDTSLIVKCTDSLNKVNYLISYKTKYKNKNNSPVISFKDLSSSDFEQIKGKYRWVELDEKEAGRITLYKILSLFGVLFSLFFIVRKVFK